MGIIISFIFGLIELILGLRFIFLLFDADESLAFVAWIYHMSPVLQAPLAPVVGHSAMPGFGGVFDWPTLFALIIYALIGGVLLSLFGRGGAGGGTNVFVGR